MERAIMTERIRISEAEKERAGMRGYEARKKGVLLSACLDREKCQELQESFLAGWLAADDELRELGEA
jgi:hypothetical protein